MSSNLDLFLNNIKIFRKKISNTHLTEHFSVNAV